MQDFTKCILYFSTLVTNSLNYGEKKVFLNIIEMVHYNFEISVILKIGKLKLNMSKKCHVSHIFTNKIWQCFLWGGEITKVK